MDLAIDCYNAPPNDYIAASNIQNCLYEYFFVNDPPPTSTSTPDIPQTFAQLVLAEWTAESLIYQLHLNNDIDFEYIAYLEQHPAILQAILKFIQAHPNYEIEVYREIITEILDFCLTIEPNDAEITVAVRYILDLVAQTNYNLDLVTTDHIITAFDNHIGGNVSGFLALDKATEIIETADPTNISVKKIKRMLKRVYHALKSKVQEKVENELYAILSALPGVTLAVVDFNNGQVYIVQDLQTIETYAFDDMYNWTNVNAQLKVGMQTIIGMNGKEKLFHWILDANGLINFGNRAQIRMGVTFNSAFEAVHHLIPVALWNHDIVQWASKYAPVGGLPFHINNAIMNGKVLSITKHTGVGCSHQGYNDKIEAELEDIKTMLIGQDGVIIPQEAYFALMALISRIRTVIDESEPNQSINDLDYTP